MPDDGVEAFARRMALLPATIVDTTPDAVRAAGDVLERAVQMSVAAATGGDSALSRVRSGRGAKIGVRVATVGSGSRTEARVIPDGPIMLIEEDTRAHVQPFQYKGGYSMARRRKAKRSGFLFIPGIGFRSRVRHPGTKGKQPVRKAFDSAHDEAGQAGLDVFADAISKHLGR